MVRILKENRLFLILYLVVLAIALVFLVKLSKGEAVLYFNGIRGPFMNNFFRFMSFVVETWMFVILGLLMVAKDYRLSIMIGVAGLSSLIFSTILKKIFSIGRPLVYFEEQGLLDQLKEVVGYVPHTGLTSFPSGHATAAFALFFLLAYIFRHRGIQVVCLFLATFSALSRVYLSNHFLLDVVIGSLLGICISFLVILVIEKLDLPEYQFSERYFKT